MIPPLRLDAPKLDARDVAAIRQPRRLAFGHGPLPEESELELRTGGPGGLEGELAQLAADGEQHQVSSHDRRRYHGGHLVDVVGP